MEENRHLAGEEKEEKDRKVNIRKMIRKERRKMDEKMEGVKQKKRKGK